MKIFLFLLLSLVALGSARNGHSSPKVVPAKSSFTSVKHLSSRQVRKECKAYVQYSVNGVKLQQANDNTSKIARSYYNKFSIEEYHIHKSNGRPTWSEFKVAIEYKTPKQVYLLGNKQVKVNFYNLLFTVSLRMGIKEKDCKIDRFSLFGFVELVKTDMTWYKGPNSITEYRECSQLKTDAQYVITKLIPGSKTIFANETAWGKVLLGSLSQERMVPIKYESSENIVVDFKKHQDTNEYERLIEKKIFLVQTNLYNEVSEVIAGVDVMMYINLVTYNVTDVPHLDIKKNHSLIKRIANPQKYVGIITDLGTKAIRQESKCSTHPQWSSISTLNPIPKNIHIYTE